MNYYPHGTETHTVKRIDTQKAQTDLFWTNGNARYKGKVIRTVT